MCDVIAEFKGSEASTRVSAKALRFGAVWVGWGPTLETRTV